MDSVVNCFNKNTCGFVHKFNKKIMPSPTNKKLLNEDTEDEAPPPPSTLLVDQPSKWRNWWIRGFWTVVMLMGFLTILYLGHFYIIALVVVMQLMVYREVIAIGIGPTQARNLPWFRGVHWLFLATTNYFLYGESLIYFYKVLEQITQALFAC